MRISTLSILVTVVFLASCQKAESPAEPAVENIGQPEVAVRQEPKAAPEDIPSSYDIYAKDRLTADLDPLSDNQTQMIRLLIDASKILDELFWLQAY
mgnify:FL=1